MSRYEVYHPQALPSNKKWAIVWTQPDFFFYQVITFVMGIGQNLLANWQGFIFMFIDDTQALLVKWEKSIFSILLSPITKDWYQQTIGISQEIDRMADNPDKLCKTTKPHDDYVWNSSRIIENLARLPCVLNKWLTR